MKKQKVALLCCGIVFSSSLWALSPLAVKEGAKTAIGNMHLMPPQTIGSYVVQYAKYDTFNRNSLGVYGITYEKTAGSGVITLDDTAYPSSQSWAKAQCVSFVKAVTVNPGATSSWKKGDVVTKDTPAWTVIAHFQGGSVYPQNPPYGHVAVLLSSYADGKAYIIDQNYIPGQGKLAARLISASERNLYHTVKK